jgi:(R,R)-butanediol dehydrogenase/meso-butanediol dehydrogenase/diacetyl reductase
MKAATYNLPGKNLRLQETATPVPGPGELLLRVSACGICGSDIHAAQNQLIADGLILGHEFSGIVEATGDGTGNHWSIGDRVIALPIAPCGSCEKCLQKEYIDCPELDLIGFSMENAGAYSECLVVPAEMAIKLPGSVNLMDAAAIEPLAVGLSAFRDGSVAIGEDILIIGAGPIGIAIAKWARFFGVQNIAISDRIPSRLERASAAGATLLIDATAYPDPVQAMVQETGRNPCVVYECVGRPLLQHLFEILPKRTRLVLVGATMEPEEVTLVTGSMKSLQLVFSMGYSYSDFEYIMQLMADQRITPEPLISGSVSLEELPKEFERLQKPNEDCKILVCP